MCDPYNHRVQVFRPDGSFSRAVLAPDGLPLSFDDMCIARDWSLYATDGWLMYVWAPGGRQFIRPERQPLPPGQEEPAGLLRLAVVAEGDAQSSCFYLEQGGTSPDRRSTTFVNRYDGQFAHQGAVEAYDLCVDVEGRRVCAMLGRRLPGPEPWEPEVLIIDTASGERHSVRLQPGDTTFRRADASLVGSDADGRLYLLVSRTLAEPTASSVRVYNPDGSLLARVRLRRWGSSDVFLGTAFPRQLMRVDAHGDVYVAWASLKEGYRIEKYSWRDH